MNLDEFYKKYNSSPSKLARAIGLKTTEDLENFMNTLKKLTIETNGEVDLYETALYNNLSLSDKIIDLIYANIENKVINVKEIAYFLNLSRFVVNRKISLRKFNTKELIKISSYIQKKESQSMKKNKKLLKTVVGLGALGIFCFSSSAKASVNQYFELQTGVNFGHNTFSVKDDEDTEKYKMVNNTNNFNLGYGINFQRKLDPTRAVSFANGVSLGLSAGLTTGGKLYSINVNNADHIESITRNYELGNKRSYNLMLNTGLDLMKYKSYKISLIAGAGLAFNSWYTRVHSNVYGVEERADMYDATSIETHNRTTFITKAGIKQEFFVAKNVSLGLELNYSYFGKYQAAIKPQKSTYEGKEVIISPASELKTTLGGQFTTNFGVKIYL